MFSYPMFANCFHTKTMFVHASEREIFCSLNCRKFAVEFDWNRKNSRNVQNLGFLEKWVFFRKKLKTFKIATCGKLFSRMRLKWYCFSKMSFHPISEVLLAKIGQNSEKN